MYCFLHVKHYQVCADKIILLFYQIPTIFAIRYTWKLSWNVVLSILSIFRQFWPVDCRWPQKPTAPHPNDLTVKKVFLHCIDIINRDYNRIRKRSQLVHKQTLKHLSKVSLNGWVFSFKVIRRWIESYCIYSNFRYSI